MEKSDDKSDDTTRQTFKIFERTENTSTRRELHGTTERDVERKPVSTLNILWMVLVNMNLVRISSRYVEHWRL